MNARTKPRTEPYVWATWISKLLAGESSCVWSAWFRAHHHVGARVETDFDMDRWQLDHTSLIRRTAAEFEKQGYTVLTERQNQFVLKGKSGTLSGRPDLVAIQGDEGWIVDAKTGQPRASDRVQVMLYMWALARSNPAYGGIRFQGRVEYTARFNLVAADEVNAGFAAQVGALMREVCGTDPPRKEPSYRECRGCPLTSGDCAERVEREVVYAAVTDEF